MQDTVRKLIEALGECITSIESKAYGGSSRRFDEINRIAKSAIESAGASESDERDYSTITLRNGEDGTVVANVDIGTPLSNPDDAAPHQMAALLMLNSLDQKGMVETWNNVEDA